MDMEYGKATDKFYIQQAKLDRNYTISAYLFDLLPLVNFRPSRESWYDIFKGSDKIEEYIFNTCIEYCVRELHSVDMFNTKLNNLITNLFIGVEEKFNTKVQPKSKFDFEFKPYITRLSSNINVLTHKLLSTHKLLTNELVSDSETDVSKYSDLYSYFMDNRTGLFEIEDLYIEMGKDFKFKGVLELVVYDKVVIC